MQIPNIIEWIKNLFNRIPVRSSAARLSNQEAARKYEDTHDVNFVAITSKKLANLTVAESKVNVVSNTNKPSQRTVMLDELIARFWDMQALRATAQAYGYGSIYLIPYIIDNEIFIDVVPQSRCVETKRMGDRITGVTALAEQREIDHQTYYRLTDYSLDGNTYKIRNRATRDGTAVPLSTVADWAGMTEEMEIYGVDRMLMGLLPCPNNHRSEDAIGGAPITYGNDKLLEDIQQCLNDIRAEYANKKVKIFADETMLDDKDQISATIFKRLMVGGKLDSGPFFEVFDPAIRDSAYFGRLQMLFDLFEKSVGVSKGVLTDPETGQATATEIKRSNYDTYALIEAMRRKWEHAVDDLVYAANVFANLIGGTPQAEYTIQWDWGYSLIENSEESFNQLKEGQSLGVISKAELRQFLRPDESLEEAQAAIDEIEQREPSLSQLLGGGNGGAA